MFEELKDRARGLLRSVDAPLSVVPSRKDDTGIVFSPTNIEQYARNGYPRIVELLGGTQSWTGEAVTTGSALALSTVWACNKVISESVGFLPLNMRQRKGNKQELATAHPMYAALRYGPNPEITAQSFSETLTSHAVLRGNAFSKIVRRSGTGTALELWQLDPDCVQVTREKTGQKRLVYVVKEQNQPDVSYTVVRGKPQDIFHMRGLGWDGMVGYSVIAMARQSFGMSLSQEKNVAQFYANGGRVPYILTMANKFENDQQFDRFRKDWQETYREPHKAPILENDIKYQQIGISAKDAQLLESRQFTIADICRWFSVSPHLVGDLSRATFSNIESLATQFVQFTLTTWLNRWEQELFRCVLTDEERAQGYFFQHDLDALLRSEFAARMAGYATALQNGWMNRDEVRAKEGLNPINGGDEYLVQVNMTSLENAGKEQPAAAPAKPAVAFGAAKE